MKRRQPEAGMFLVNDVPFQEVFTPEDFNTEHHDIANAVEDFINGEIISLGEEIEIVNNDLSRRLYPPPRVLQNSTYGKTHNQRTQPNYKSKEGER